MAARLPDGNMQALQQFVNQSPWEHTAVLRRIAERLVPLIDPAVWVIDDVAFPKWGTSSVAVAPQYCPALGKQANCQIAVSVHAATDAASVPLNWRLFLPESWATDRARCARVGVPKTVGYREKWRLALDMLDEVAGWGLTVPVVVADAGYGQNAYLRAALAQREHRFVVAVRGDELAHQGTVVPVQSAYGGLGPPTKPRYRDKPVALAGLAVAEGRGAFSEVTWRQGSQGPLRSHFRTLTIRPAGRAARRLAAEAAKDSGQDRDGVLPAYTLLVEWPDDQDEPTDYWITNLSQDTPVSELVCLAKMRWRIEHEDRELKHGLGLDHFEGRTWRGWHHHVTLVTAAQAFLTEARLNPKAAMPA
jgi:SRSO17 transposase